MRGQALYCFLGSSIVGTASSVLWAAGAKTPLIGGMLGLAAGFLGACVYFGSAARHHA
jgi:hypothetical protein